MNGNLKLWTGKTVREELVSFATVAASVKNLTACEGIECALDGNTPEEGSIKHSMVSYWCSASSSVQNSLISEIKRNLRERDALLGEKHNR